jgi:hypothetical protein
MITMKNIIFRLIFTVHIVLLTALSLIAQPPPPPPPPGGGGGGGPTPVGGPIFDGLFIIIAMASIYAGLVLYRMYKKQKAFKEAS